MTLHLQAFLREGNPISTLEEKYAIKATPHPKYPHLILFKYNQIDSPFGERIVQECRGIILNSNDNWSIVSRPFDKFFNHGEGHAAEIDWKSAKVLEKIDGSLATLYPYDGQWHISTSGSPAAAGNVKDYPFTFEELFWKTFDQIVGKKNLPPLDCGKCFFFELTSIFNKIVVVHPDPSLTILGGRCLKTQKELTHEEVSTYFPKCPVVKSFPLTSFEEAIETFATMSPLSQEGYVIVDGNFNRQKVKHPGYVALHHLADELGSRRALAQVVLNGEIDEVVVAFPEHKNTLLEIKGKLEVLVDELEAAYEEIKGIENQKEFALKALTSKCSSALFAVRRGNVKSVVHFLRKMHIDSVMKLLGMKTTIEKPMVNE